MSGTSRRGPARQDAILAAALECITEIGYGRLTMDVLAARARASKATIYRRWPGKAELVADALRRHAEAGGPGVTDTGTLAGDLRAAVDGIASAGTALLGVLEAVRDDARLRELVRHQIEDAATRNGGEICARAGAVPGDEERRRLVGDVLVPLLRGTTPG